MKAFSERVDPAHVEQVYDSVPESVEEAKRSTNRAGWQEICSWNDSGCKPEHYILPKYKDIVAD